MNIIFDNSTEIKLEEDIYQKMKSVIKETLEHENFPKNIEVSVSLVTNQEIKKINKKFRKIDKETDVLSFPLIEDFSQDFSKQKETPIYLGDIIISIEKAISQAKDYNHSLMREISFLTVHSMLHLLGYDHIIKEDEEIMLKKQDEILNKLKITR